VLSSRKIIRSGRRQRPSAHVTRRSTNAAWRRPGLRGAVSASRISPYMMRRAGRQHARRIQAKLKFHGHVDPALTNDVKCVFDQDSSMVFDLATGRCEWPMQP